MDPPNRRAKGGETPQKGTPERLVKGPGRREDFVQNVRFAGDRRQKVLLESPPGRHSGPQTLENVAFGGLKEQFKEYFR